MIYMLLFWGVMILTIIIYVIAKKVEIKLEKLVMPLLFFSLALLIVAIVTKDPLFSSFGIPPEFEWVIGLFITGFTSWKVYFDPLKSRVIRTEREVFSLKTEIGSVKSDTSLIKEILIGKKK